MEHLALSEAAGYFIFKREASWTLTLLWINLATFIALTIILLKILLLQIPQLFLFLPIHIYDVLANS
jgi:hypothetical protein